MKDMDDVDPATWNEIIEEVDEDGDGEISFAEFKKMMHRLVDPNIKQRQMTVQPKLFMQMIESDGGSGENGPNKNELSMIQESEDDKNSDKKSNE